SEPLDPIDERIQRRNRVRADRIGGTPEPFDEPHDTERGTDRVRIRVLMRDGQDAPRPTEPLDDDVRHSGQIGRQIHGHRDERLVLAVFAEAWRPRRRRGFGGTTAEGGSSDASPSWPTRATGVGKVSPAGNSMLGSARPDSSYSRRGRPRGPRP